MYVYTCILPIPRVSLVINKMAREKSERSKLAQRKAAAPQEKHKEHATPTTRGRHLAFLAHPRAELAAFYSYHS